MTSVTSDVELVAAAELLLGELLLQLSLDGGNAMFSGLDRGTFSWDFASLESDDGFLDGGFNSPRARFFKLVGLNRSLADRERMKCDDGDPTGLSGALSGSPFPLQ